MSALKSYTIKRKILSILILSGLLRLLTFLFLPKLVFPNLAPDEGMYAALAKWLGESNPVNVFPGYGDIIYHQSKAFILPASLLFRLGINELDAIRIISSLYGLGSLVVVGLFAFKYLTNSKIQRLEKVRRNLVIGAVILYALIPSHFLWSILGLRESSVEFWTLLTFFSIYKINQSRKWELSLWVSATIVGISMVFNSRPQVGWLLCASLILSTIISEKNRKTLVIIIAVACGMVAGNLLNETYTLERATSYVLNSVDGTTTKIDSGADSLCLEPKQIVFLENKKYECNPKNRTIDLLGFSNPGNVLINNIEGITAAQEVRKSSAASEIQTFPCPVVENSRASRFFCISVRAPYMAATFLMRPFVFIDTTSFSSYFAAAENILWMAAFLVLLYGLVRFRRKLYSKEALPMMIFLVTYVIGAGSYQGNLGTAFRHKSLILWALLLCVYKVVLIIIEGRIKAKNGNNSQESAV